MAKRQKILLVGPAWVGDMVMAQALFMLLRERLPEARIDVLAPALTASLLSRMPQVDQATVLAVGHGEWAWRRRRASAQALAAIGYNQAIILQRSVKAALVPWLAGIPRRTGYRGEWRYGLLNDIRRVEARDPRKIAYYARLGLAGAHEPLPALAKPQLSVDTANRARLVAAYGLDLGRPIVGLAPGAAYGPAKRWPVAYYVQLAGELDALGVACWVFGGHADRDLSRPIAAAAYRHGVDFGAQTQLVDVIDLASLTTRFVGNDTGTLHLAAACAPRVLGIYGATDPKQTPLLGARTQHFWLGLPCSPCHRRVCPLGHHACMRDIPVADVLAGCLPPATPSIRPRHRGLV